MRKKLTTIAGTDVWQDDSGKVEFITGAALDSDGANGQSGGVGSYRKDDKGLDYLANGGMKIRAGQVVWAADWGKDVALVRDGQPMVLESGIIPSKTSYRIPGMSASDPNAYLDSENVPYIVTPPQIRNLAKGIVLGCQGKVSHINTGLSVICIVGDVGPKSKIGEISIAAARALGIPSSPKSGGTDKKILRYELFPDEPAEVNGVKYSLIPT